MGSEQRRQPRAKCYAKVLFSASMTPGYIRDLSRTGCQISFVQQVPADIGRKVSVEVVAGPEPFFEPFTLGVTVRWVKIDGIFFSLGGEIAEVSGGFEEGPFSRLVEYYQE